MQIGNTKPPIKPLIKAGATVGGLGSVVLLGYIAKPFVLAATKGFPVITELREVSAGDNGQWNMARRRQYFELMIRNQAAANVRGKINWYQFADVVDFVAHNTPSEEDFRQDIWHLFGWHADGKRSPLSHLLDPMNRGLPVKFHNSSYQSEQMHHYLGGTTGNTEKLPSHLLNSYVYAYLYELKELFATGKYNWGDVRLFNHSQKHRDDFLKHGRFTVAQNIRAMLSQPTTQPVSFSKYA